MLKVGRQQPSTHIGTPDTALPWSTNQMLPMHHHQHTSIDKPPAEFAVPKQQHTHEHTSKDKAGADQSDTSQKSTAQPNRSTMDEWADIFDQCKTAMNGAKPTQEARVPYDQLPLFNRALTPHLYTHPDAADFQTVGSLNSDDDEDCMFGSDEDESPELRGIKVTGLFRNGVDDWSRPQVQVLHVFYSQVAPHQCSGVSVWRGIHQRNGYCIPSMRGGKQTSILLHSRPAQSTYTASQTQLRLPLAESLRPNGAVFAPTKRMSSIHSVSSLYTCASAYDYWQGQPGSCLLSQQQNIKMRNVECY